MSLATLYTRASCGVDAPLVTVETHLSNGLPAFNIVGLPEKAVKESKDRVRSALLNSHFEFPAKRITVNLAPADLPKDGGRYDLAIALGILAASGQIPQQALDDTEFLGELALTGELRPIQGIIPAVVQATNAKNCLFIPAANAEEAGICKQATVYPVKHLLELSAHLYEREQLTPVDTTTMDFESITYPDLADVQGQATGKRALEIAAAGQHHILFYGPPGTGKTMLASRLPGILPSLTEAERLEVASIESVSQTKPISYRSIQRPFRSPHHTASAVALVGGGSHPKPGEISLAHKGVLFLDELPLFQRQVLEVLREPLESGNIMISRANQQVEFPADFQLVAAMNPCACGYYGDLERSCICSPDQLRRYQDKLSGPFLDRIDLFVPMVRIPTRMIINPKRENSESSEQVKQRVKKARDFQLQRQGFTNAQLDGQSLLEHCELTQSNRNLLEKAIDHLQLSSRATHRILRVARTIADCEQSEKILGKHLSEAINYRSYFLKRE